MIRVSIDPASPQAAILERAARIVREGGVVALPTDTLYGLAADPFSPAAVARVFEAKRRRSARALPLIAADHEQIVRCLGALPPIAERLAGTFWPGPLTLLLDAPAALASGVTGGTGHVGVRIPAHPVARALCFTCTIPLTATSANLTDRPATADPDEVERALGSRVEFLLDAGPISGGLPSTVVDVTGVTPRLVRAGAIGWDEVLACVGRI
jgi:L-threonylcarbamoyladenylate synthase